MNTSVMKAIQLILAMDPDLLDIVSVPSEESDGGVLC